MNRPAIADLLRVPAAAYTTFTLDDDVIDVWHASLATFDAAVVRAAVGRWIQTNDRPPTPAQIVAEVRQELRDRARDREASTLVHDRPDPVRARGTYALLREVVRGDVAAADAVAIAKRRGLVAPDVNTRCRCDRGWLTRHTGDVVPCQSCSPELHRRWADGALDGPLIGRTR